MCSTKGPQRLTKSNEICSSNSTDFIRKICFNDLLATTAKALKGKGMQDNGIVEELKCVVITIAMNNILYKCHFCIIFKCQLASNFLKIVRW